MHLASPHLELRGVSKGYASRGGRTEVLSDVNLSVARGEFVAIVGRSGSGKTTLVSLAAGLIAPDCGTIHVNGREISGPDSNRGIVFQNYSLLPWLSVRGNVQLAVDQVAPQMSAKERRAVAERYVAMVHLTPAANKLPRDLSGGMRQRVAVARALAMNPEILLLDEPLGALDALTRGTLQAELQHICEHERKTVLLITNDIDEGLLLADRMFVMTAAPGSTLGTELTIHAPRPRRPRDLTHDPEFQRLRREIAAMLTTMPACAAPTPTRWSNHSPPRPARQGVVA